MLKKIENNLILFTVLSAVIYLFIGVYADSGNLLKSIASFPISSFILVFFIILVSFSIKFWRWHYYLIISGIQLRLKDSILIYLSGFIMSFSPGKIGELIKSLLIKKKFSLGYSETIPVVVAERIIEFFTLLIICSAGLIILKFEIAYIIGSTAISVIIFFTVQNKTLLQKILKIIAGYSPIKKRIDSLVTFELTFSRLFQKGIFLKASFLSLSAWIVELFGFFIVLNVYDNSVSAVWSGFIYSISIILGAVSMIPGGIGATEASLSYFLINSGIQESSAVASTLLIRLLTLWLSVFIGFLSIIVYIRMNKLSIDD